jgi:hypothetical protein
MKERNGELLDLPDCRWRDAKYHDAVLGAALG